MHMPFMNRVSLLPLLPVLCVTLAACGKNTPAPSAAAGPPLASIVVQTSPTPQERDVDGTIEAINQATVSAQTSGRIVEILYDVNDVVPAGAVIMKPWSPRSP